MTDEVLYRVRYGEETLKLPAYQGAEDYRFWCEGCDAVHHIRAKGPRPAWNFNGDMVNPTFSPSHLTGWENFTEHRCHSFIENGNIKYLNDCFHSLAGKTVRLLTVDKWRYGNGD